MPRYFQHQLTDQRYGLWPILRGWIRLRRKCHFLVQSHSYGSADNFLHVRHATIIFGVSADKERLEKYNYVRSL